MLKEKFKYMLLSASDFILSSRKDTLFVKIDEFDCTCMKIQVGRADGKLNSLKQEYDILKYLNSNGCMSAPHVYHYSTGNNSDWLDLIDKLKSNEPEKVEIIEFLESKKDEIISFDFFTMEHIIGDDSYSLADIVFSMLEQKSLGIYHGDIKPNNILFDKSLGICRFYDYDQAFSIPKDLSNSKFFHFCDQYDKGYYKANGWLRHFKHKNWSNESLRSLFEHDSFDMSKTTVFKKQKTTNSSSGIYHTIEHKDIFIDGSRTLDGRLPALEKIKFDNNETVVDLGCNAGLLTFYLANRCCNAIGLDNDIKITTAAKMIANIMKVKADFHHFDADHLLIDDTKNPFTLDPIKYFYTIEKPIDTVMLFSVLHHTRNPTYNAAMIGLNCKRIILETRLIESGKQPDENGNWVNTSYWSFENIDQLVSYMETLFQGFKQVNEIVQCDKGRFVIEFRKQSS